MSTMTQNLLFIQAIRDHLEQIESLCRDEWSSFRERLLALLRAMERWGSLIKFFADAGAAGIIGTQCLLQENLTDEFIRRFFRFFLQREPVGKAMFQARLELLTTALPDPRALAYSLFAAADVTLALPIPVLTVNAHFAVDAKNVSGSS